MSSLNVNNGPITVSKDIPATTVPNGDTILLSAGGVVQIAQQLGGSVTVRTEMGTLLRIDGEHFDALGLEIPERNVAIASGRPFSMDLVMEQLDTVYDPEIPISIVALGLIYRAEEVIQDDGTRLIEIDLSMTAPGCGMGDILKADADKVTRAVNGVDDVRVELVFEPPWGMERISDEAKLELGLF